MSKRPITDRRIWDLAGRIASNIRRIRTEKGFTQEDMGDRGLGPRWYQRLESGRQIPTIPTLDKLARVFKVDIREFFQ